METLKRVKINRYTGYHHNRYDGYCSSRGILAACGGSSCADCFADDEDSELDDDIYEGKTPIDWTDVLCNLEIDEDDLNAIENGEAYEHTEYWGNEPVKIVFSGNPIRTVSINDGEFIANY